MVWRKIPKLPTFMPIEANPSLIKPSSSPIQVEIIAIPAIGAAVASTMKANFSRDT